MKVNPDFLVEQINSLDIPEWQKEGLGQVLSDFLDGKSAAVIRERLTSQLGEDFDEAS